MSVFAATRTGYHRIRWIRYATSHTGQASLYEFRTPPELLRAVLIAERVGNDPSVQDASWPVFVDHLPHRPHQAICVYRTTGIRDGRIMQTGHSVRHPGWQIRVRGLDYAAVWSRVRRIQIVLDSILRREVEIGGQWYIIQAVTQTGDALDLGQEPGADRRSSVTINGTMTI